MPNEKYDHRIEWNELENSLIIYRIHQSANETLYTELSFRVAKKMGVEKFSRQLGEVLLADSPVGRRIFDLD